MVRVGNSTVEEIARANPSVIAVAGHQEALPVLGLGLAGDPVLTTVTHEDPGTLELPSLLVRAQFAVDPCLDSVVGPERISNIGHFVILA